MYYVHNMQHPHHSRAGMQCRAPLFHVKHCRGHAWHTTAPVVSVLNLRCGRNITRFIPGCSAAMLTMVSVQGLTASADHASTCHVNVNSSIKRFEWSTMVTESVEGLTNMANRHPIGTPTDSAGCATTNTCRGQPCLLRLHSH